MSCARSLLRAALALALCPAPARSQAPATSPAPRGVVAAPRVAGVTLRLAPADEQERRALEELIAIAPGSVLSTRALRRTVQLIWQKGRCRNVLVRERPAAPPAPPASAPAEGATWVELEIECLPIRRLRRLETSEAGVATAVIDPARREAAAALRAGEPWEESDLAAVRERIAAAYARRGWRAAEVEGSASGDAEVVVRVTVRPGPPTLVAKVSLEGEGSAAAALLLADLSTRPGAILDEDALAEDARTLLARLRAAGYRRAHVGVSRIGDGPAGVEVTFPVEPGAPMRLVLEGGERFGTAELTAAMGLKPEDSFDPPSLDAAADRLRAFYRVRGYAAVAVRWTERPRAGEVVIALRVDEGRRYRLRNVGFAGVTYRDEEWLRERLLAILEEEGGADDTLAADRRRERVLSVPDGRPQHDAPPPLPARDRWEEGAWDRAVVRLVDWYRNEGFLDAEHAGTTVELDRRLGTVDVTVRMSEGTRTFVETISFEGNAAVSLPDLARSAHIAPGAPLSWEAVEGTRGALLRLYVSRGYLFARAEVREAPGSSPSTARIVYRLDEGPRVKLGRVVVTGNRRTEDDVVRNALSVREGDWYDPMKISRSQAALLRLGVFRSVALRLREPEVPEELKDLSIELAERPWQTLSPGAGFSIANGPRAFVEWQRPNLFGRAVELAVRAKVNYPLEAFRPDLAGEAPRDRFEGRADAGLRVQRFDLLSLPLGARLDAIGERLNRPAYRLTRGSTVAGLDLAVTGQASLSLQYELEIDKIQKGQSTGPITQADLERLRFNEGVTTLQSIRPSFTLDYRDNSTHPQRGWFGSGSLEWSRSIGGSVLFGLLPGSDIHNDFLKAMATLTGYLPVGGGSTLAVSARVGRVFPLDPTSRIIIIPRRFFLGGASSMRGWGEEEMIGEDVRGVVLAEARACAVSATDPGCTDRGRSVNAGSAPVSEGGEAFVLFKAEVRVPLKGSLEAGFFADLGNLWLYPDAMDVTQLRADLGFGLRFVTPIGPAALDLGFNVNPDGRLNERIFAPHFTVGLF
jgi:outer membrane protein assembly complex protein YaeT